LSTILQDARTAGYPPSRAIATQPEVVQYDNAYRHLPPNGTCFFGSTEQILRGRFYSATGSQSFSYELWMHDRKNGFGPANRSYRVSEPLDLNAFTPTYAKKVAGKEGMIIYATAV
jgi:hypothetical protein